MAAWGDSVSLVTDVCRSLIGVVLSSHSMAVHPNVSWSLPAHNSIKINVDSPFSSSSGANGIGGVFRDHHGFFSYSFYEASRSGSNHSYRNAGNHLGVKHCFGAGHYQIEANFEY